MPTDPLHLHAAVQKLLADEAMTIPDHHGVVGIVDIHGARVGLATRLGDGWTFQAETGYDWSSATKGFRGQLQIQKVWD